MIRKKLFTKMTPETQIEYLFNYIDEKVLDDVNLNSRFERLYNYIEKGKQQFKKIDTSFMLVAVAILSLAVGDKIYDNYYRKKEINESD